jgi:hypothetical protein
METFTCALTTGTDIPLTQNKTAKNNSNFFLITLLVRDRRQLWLCCSRPSLFEIARVLVRSDHVE